MKSSWNEWSKSAAPISSSHYERQACDLLQVQEADGAGRDLVSLFDEFDARMGVGSNGKEDQGTSPVFVQKLQNAFTHDRHELDHRLQTWVKHIIENPAQRRSRPVMG